MIDIKNPRVFRIFILPLLSLLFIISANAQEYVLVWGDEFNTPGLPDSTKWNYEEGFVRNAELQYYTAQHSENARIEDTVLIIEAHKENFKDADYTSASLISRGIGDWKYGKIEISAKVPTGKGTWPALWMMPTYSEYGGWPRSGEIDIMEYIGVEPQNLFYNAHFEGTDGSGHQSSGSGPIDDIQNPYEKFIKFTLIWTPEKLEWYANDVLYHEYIKPSEDYRVWPFNEHFYLILNLAYGGSWGGYDGVDDSKLPHQFYIDYVRVYKLQESEGPFNLKIEPYEGGNVEVTPNLESYPDGTEVILTATPDEGYDFKAWRHYSGANPYAFTIRNNTTISPFFFDAVNILSNGTFFADSYPWSFYVNSNSIEYDSNVENNELNIDIIQPPSSNWELGFQETGLSLEKGYYNLSFDAYAEHPASLLVTVSKNYSDWGALITKHINITEEKDTLNLLLKMETTDENVRLFFGIGNFTGAFHIDNISLKHIDEYAIFAALTEHQVDLFSSEEKQFSMLGENQHNDEMIIPSDSIIWHCDSSLGEISVGGLFKAAQTAGVGYIYASYKSFSDSCKVTISEIAVVDILPDSLTIDSLHTFSFENSFLDPTGNELTIPATLYEWFISDNDLANLNNEGMFTPISEGELYVILQSNAIKDSALVSIECGQEHLFIDQLNAPITWDITIENMDSAKVTPLDNESFSGGFIFDYYFTYAGETPVLSLSKNHRIFGLPDSLLAELEGGEEIQTITANLETREKEALNPSFEYRNNGFPSLCGTSLEDLPLTVYPLTFKSLQIAFNAGDEQYTMNESYRGQFLIRNLLVTYPGHELVPPNNPYFTYAPAINKGSDFLLYPNPAHSFVHVNLPDNRVTENAHLRLISMDGRLLLKKYLKQRETILNLGTIQSGVYLIELTTGKQTTTRRLVVE